MILVYFDGVLQQSTLFKSIEPFYKCRIEWERRDGNRHWRSVESPRVDVLAEVIDPESGQRVWRRYSGKAQWTPTEGSSKNFWCEIPEESTG